MKPSDKNPSLETIHEFLDHRIIAVAGASRNKQKFGNVIFRELIKKGYEPVPLNPNTEDIEGYKCYPTIETLPVEVKALVLVTPPAQSYLLVQEALSHGIKHIWIQQGAESPEVLDFCKKNQINYISGHCILMFLEPVKSIHKLHRFFSKLFGAYPT
jgi:predicted CoA-binding protein